MKNICADIKESSIELLEEACKVRNKSMSDMIDEIVSDYFSNLQRTSFPEITFDESKEIWKDIPGYEGLYQASNMGRVASIRYGFKLMSLLRHPTGYLQVAFRVNNKISRFMVHRLVAITFIDKSCEDCNEVDHMNHVRSDNRAENLQWVSRSTNMKSNYLRGGAGIKEKQRSKGKKVQILDENDNILGTFDKVCDAAEHFGVWKGNLSATANPKSRSKTAFSKSYNIKVKAVHI